MCQASVSSPAHCQEETRERDKHKAGHFRQISKALQSSLFKKGRGSDSSPTLRCGRTCKNLHSKGFLAAVWKLLVGSLSSPFENGVPAAPSRARARCYNELGSVSAIGMLRYCQNRERKTLQSSQFLLAFDVLQRMSDAITTAQATKCAECALCACVSWSCGRSPSLQERRKGIFSTSWPCEDVAKARYCKLQQTGGSSSRNTDLGLLTV